MGLQGTHITNGASVLVIEQACDNDQLLVSLSKNAAQWLSPVGWTDQQKVTLLDCRQNGKTTEIDIPAEFASDIKSGDILVLRCSELDFETEIIWEASEVETRLANEEIALPTGLASGLLSRFKGSKAEPAEETRTEAEVRAEEADRAAQNFKAKMEAATAAKEEAQRKALDAAREAEAALKMEADRIAEMERAAKAFEEAERLKQDEHRRVEEERRAEEARLAEEARRIEEARKREIAAKKEAERKAALKRYETALDVTRNEEARLKGRLKDLKKRAKSGADNFAVQSEDLDVRRASAETIQNKLEKRSESYAKSASTLESLTADLSLLQADSDALAENRKAVSGRLTEADIAYQNAQKEAEAAMAFAQKCRAKLDEVRKEDEAVSAKLSAMSESLSKNSHLVAKASEKSYKLKSSYDQSHSELSQAQTEIEALEQALAAQAEKDQGLRLEIEATQQAVEDSGMREDAHRNAIEHLEAGGAPEDIAEIDFEARSFEKSKLSAKDDAGLTENTPASSGLKSRVMGRVRRSRLAREKEAEISVDVEDVILLGADKKTDAVLLAAIDDSPSFVRRHSSSLMALGAIIGGIAILGGGLAMNKSTQPTLQVKSSTPVPTQVASAVTKVASSVTPVTKKLPVSDTVKDSQAVTKKAEIKEITPKKEMPAAASPTEKLPVETAILDTVPDADLSVKKLASVVDPVGFAFELPDMRPLETPKTKTALVKKSTIPAPKAKSVKSVQKAAVKKAALKKPAKIVAVKRAAPKAEAVVNYPELTTDIQMRLTDLGFYRGQIDGLQNAPTQEAIKSFKALFGMTSTDAKITGSLLTELKKVEREQQAAEKMAQAQALLDAQTVIQVAEAAPSVRFYDTVRAVPSAPVRADTLPAATEYTPFIDATPAYISSEPAPVRVASIQTAISEPAPTPAVQSVIVEAKMLKGASAKYPLTAQRRNYFTNVAIVVNYDIGTSGQATNITIASNDHTGRYNAAFEKEAINAVRKLRYAPKTINGVAVGSKGQQKRIVFKAE